VISRDPYFPTDGLWFRVGLRTGYERTERVGRNCLFVNGNGCWIVSYRAKEQESSGEVLMSDWRKVRPSRCLRILCERAITRGEWIPASSNLFLPFAGSSCNRERDRPIMERKNERMFTVRLACPNDPRPIMNRRPLQFGD